MFVKTQVSLQVKMEVGEAGEDAENIGKCAG